MFEGILQPTHLLLILGIMLIVFGPRKLPELGRGLGEAIRGFRDGLRPPSGEAEPPRPADPKP
jgi:sec-independent protein translocase protein TatA